MTFYPPLMGRGFLTAWNPGSDAIWRARSDSDPFYQQVLLEAAPAMPCPPMPQALSQPGMPQPGMPQTGMPQNGMGPQTAMAGTTGTTQPMMCEATPVEGQTWAPWQNWNSWNESNGNSQTWHFNVPAGYTAPPAAPDAQMWPGDVMWQQNQHTGETQWQSEQPTQTWQREPGQEILKQLGVGNSGGGNTLSP